MGIDKEQKDAQTTFRPFRSAETEQPAKEEKTTHGSVSRSDLYVMSFLGFISGGVLILGLLFLTGAITGEAVWDLSGEEEVIVEETVPVIEAPITNTTENTTIEEEVVEAVVEEVVEESDPCGPDNEITLALGDPFEYNGREIEAILAGDFSAQIAVGGLKEFISVGETLDINGLDITMLDGSEADGTTVIYVEC